jgi:hypothetical protein
MGHLGARRVLGKEFVLGKKKNAKVCGGDCRNAFCFVLNLEEKMPYSNAVERQRTYPGGHPSC